MDRKNEKKESELSFNAENLAVPEVIIEEEAEAEEALDAAAQKEKEENEDDEPHLVFDTLAVPEVDFSKLSKD